MKNLHRFLNFASPRVLPKTCPALSRDQAVLLSSWVNNRIPGRQGESKSRPFSAILVYLNYVCFGIECVLMIVASLGYAINLSSPFRTLAFLLAGLLLTQTSAHAAIRSVSALKKADLAT